MFLTQNICKGICFSLLLLTVACKQDAKTDSQTTSTSEPSTQSEPMEKSASSAPKEDQSKVVATVNDVPIYLKEVSEFIARDPQLGPAVSQGITLPPDIKEKVLDVLIERQVLLQVASKKNLLSDKELSDAQQSYLAMYGGEENLKKVLANSGATMESFKENLRSDLILKKYYEEEVAKKVTVTEDEMKKEFTDNQARYTSPPMVRARHILVTVPQDAPADKVKAAEENINAIYEEVSKPGTDFGEVAKARSDCPSKAKGGDLGFFSKEMMVPEFSNAAFAMKPGEISKPIRSQFGFHIIKLEEQKAGGVPKFEEIKKNIEENLRMAKETDIGRPMLDKLKAEAKITRTLG